jgi:hypothetical protein
MGASFAILGLISLAWVSSRPRLTIVKLGIHDTNERGEVCECFMLTNSSAARLVYGGIGFEFRSQSGWSKLEHGKVSGPGRKPYETGIMYGGETLEPRSGFVFVDAHRKSTDARPYRYAVLWALPPKDAESRPRWEKWFDGLAIKWLARPLLLPYGVVRSPTLIPEGPNPQGGANGRQPFSSDTNSTSAGAASRRSP